VNSQDYRESSLKGKHILNLFLSIIKNSFQAVSGRAVDPPGFYADPDRAFYLITDPDQDPVPDTGF
jgi:hypothetical protein